jgi:hypothetical protein
MCAIFWNPPNESRTGYAMGQVHCWNLVKKIEERQELQGSDLVASARPKTACPQAGQTIERQGVTRSHQPDLIQPAQRQAITHRHQNIGGAA